MWISGKPDLKPDAPLFPVSDRVPGGKDRRTYKMMRTDLEAARKKWIDEAQTERQREEREQSDFLAYKDHDGLYADFHYCRHLFITSLERAGISPKMAQTLARHSDIRLTLQTYTHVELHDQTAAIRALPEPGGAALHFGDHFREFSGSANGWIACNGEVRDNRPTKSREIDPGTSAQ